MDKPIIHVDVKVVSSQRKHGSSGAKPSKVKSAASSKFNALVNRLKNLSKEEDKDKDVRSDSEDNNNSTETGREKGVDSKPYGSHTGNIQVAHLVTGDYSSDNLDELSTYIANVTSYLESKHSFDLKAAKNAYKTFKDDLSQRYAEKYGTNLSEETTTVFLNTLKSKSFLYTSHQIVITITSDVEIMGARQNPEGKWVLILKSKMIYSEGHTLLSNAEIQAMKNMPKDKVELKVTSITRIPAILVYDAQTSRYIAVFKSRNNAIVYDSY